MRPRNQTTQIGKCTRVSAHHHKSPKSTSPNTDHKSRIPSPQRFSRHSLTRSPPTWGGTVPWKLRWKVLQCNELRRDKPSRTACVDDQRAESVGRCWLSRITACNESGESREGHGCPDLVRRTPPGVRSATIGRHNPDALPFQCWLESEIKSRCPNHRRTISRWGTQGRFGLSTPQRCVPTISLRPLPHR